MSALIPCQGTIKTWPAGRGSGDVGCYANVDRRFNICVRASRICAAVWVGAPGVHSVGKDSLRSLRKVVSHYGYPTFLCSHAPTADLIMVNELFVVFRHPRYVFKYFFIFVSAINRRFW